MMKPFIARIAFVFTTITAAPAIAQDYSVPWFTVDGGGGSAATSGYSVSGTIGQSDAGMLSGAGFVVQGGFWSGLTEGLSSPGAPLLRITVSSQGAILTWPNPSVGFELQEASELGAWSNVTSPIEVNANNEKQVALPLQPGSRFFRLRRP